MTAFFHAPRFVNTRTPMFTSGYGTRRGLQAASSTIDLLSAVH
jgi:hypothetical protein